jgi:Na+(H+)/acetate symporter ActP
MVELVTRQSVLAGMFFHVIAACFVPAFIMSVWQES